MEKEFLLKDLVIKHVRLKKQKEQREQEIKASKITNIAPKVKELNAQVVFFLLMVLGLGLLEVIQLPTIS